MTRNFVFNTLSRVIDDCENVRAVVEVFNHDKTSEIILIDFDPLPNTELLDDNLPRVGVWSAQTPECEEFACGEFRSYDEAVERIYDFLLNNNAELYIDSL